MKSVMTHNFAQVPRADIPRSVFNRSCGFKTTFDAGYLVPVFVDEMLPGDTFNLSASSFCRLTTPLVPIMDNMYLDFFFFFVPNRLVWDNWKRFNGEQPNPGDSTSFLVPKLDVATMPVGGFPADSLGDYFGLPTETTNPLDNINVLPFRCVNLIWNEWFRDENLQTSLPVPKDDGPDSWVTNYSATAYGVYDPGAQLPRRGKRHDYLTSSLPWPQKGPAVTLPLGTSAPVVTNNTIPSIQNAAHTSGTKPLNANTDATQAIYYSGAAMPALTGFHWVSTGMQTDLTAATAATINQLRQSFQIQKLYERDARGGTRYTEIIRAHFGVTSPDARLQRPEYLGGGSFPIVFSSVPQTAPAAGGSTPQGNLAAYATSANTGQVGFTYSATEHGYIIGFVSARADLNYQNGVDRMWSRRTRFDFYWPALSHIGEQTVLQKEVLANGTAADELAWGYNERYAEYRFKQSKITGRFRSNYAQPLDMWHLAQDLSSGVSLNGTFIQEKPPVDRILAVENEPHFLGDFYFTYKCARPMPVYSVPGLIDHF